MLTVELEVLDKPGVLMRVVGVITAKGENIRRLKVDPDPERRGVTRIVLEAELEPEWHGRVVNQMNRLIEVLEARQVMSAAS